MTGSPPAESAPPAYAARVDQLLRRLPAWTVWVTLGIGFLGLLLPWVLAPVTSDERYHYPAAPYRMDGNLLNVLPWTIDDMEWRMAAGRIAPVGVFAQHVVYLLGMQFAFSTGTPLFVVHGIVKILLLVLAVLSFALLLAQLRRRDGERLDPHLRRTAVLIFAALVALGVTTVSPTRNGWTTFVVLCIGGITLMFLAGAASLWTLRSWSRRGPVFKVVGALGLALLGVVIMLSYEMHWAATPFSVLLLAMVGPAPWRHRIVLIASLAGGWLAAVWWSREAIKAATKVTYVGLEVDLTGAVPRTAALQLINALPGVGITRVIDDVGVGLPVPQPFGGSGWVWGLLVAIGLSLLMTRRTNLWSGLAAGERQPMLALAMALVASALAAAVILSVSVQSPQIVSSLGSTYRGTPWIWACLAGVLALGALALPGRPRVGRAVLISGPATLALLVGILVWPTNVSAVQTLRAMDQYALWESAQAQLVTGSPEPKAEQRRCLIARQWRGMTGRSPYFVLFLPHYEKAFDYQWDRPWCSQGRTSKD